MKSLLGLPRVTSRRARKSNNQSKSSKVRRARSVAKSNKASTRTRHHIGKALSRFRARRDVDIQATEICESANITTPTFYGYYDSPSDALHAQEIDIERRFVESLPKNAKRDVVFTKLLSFIHEERDYFICALQTLDLYLLLRLLEHTRPLLVNEEAIDVPTSNAYIGTIMIVVVAWAFYHNCSKSTITEYTERLLALRVNRWKKYTPRENSTGHSCTQH